MNSEAHTLNISQQHKSIRLPKSARGRALFTVDWFLNGSPQLLNHDNKCSDALKQLAIHYSYSY